MTINKTKPEVLTRLLKKQVLAGVKAAVAGDSLGRVAAGISIQKNLKVLAQICAAERAVRVRE